MILTLALFFKHSMVKCKVTDFFYENSAKEHQVSSGKKV